MLLSPALEFNSHFFIVIVVLLLVIASMYLMIRISRKAKGRTTREFESSKTTREFPSEENIWEIVDRWAKMKKYKLIEKGENARIYRRRGISTLLWVPQVQVACSDGRSQLSVWLFMRKIARFLNPALAVMPNETAIDKESFIRKSDWWPLSPGRIITVKQPES